ncbi:MFS transporter [Shouchella clausii]|jgi:MFS transporter, SP family, inositol transporter|uniref:Major facilitator superfamily (MFS) family inositol transporter n=3 Tax=Shouchella TaxID=2893057 RepID=Q5WL36_SHOC1|nr:MULTISPECIES: MFS transporter [Shouchella]MCM3314332.1 MFS transporter [Psychrobacillus sp. MER TA 17]ALA52504.1 putative L-rhamnose permease RhaY [Shouchella clausii]KKI88227.1 major facilitator transporter [Shouchella clausii]MBU3230081.1 MFS transporter [Shouchella clausii]MBU3262720.1 MFS transporter [Shouchella clausii]
MVRQNKGMKATITVAMSNYLEAGAIVAGAGGLTLWVEYLQLTDMWVGLLGALSANGFGAAIGALIGGALVDRYGRKFIYKYDLLLYMAGMLLIVFAFSFPMLLAGYVIVGIAVGALIPAAWTYIAEEAPPNERAARVGWSQFAWSIGPAITLFLSVALAPLGLLGSRLIFAQLFVVAIITWILQQQINESQIWEKEQEKARLTQSGQAAVKGSLKDLFTIKANLKALIFLIGIYFFWNLVAGTMGYFMPYIYETVGGLSAAQANLLQGVLWTFTVIATYAVFIKLGDKVNRKLLFGTGGVLGIIAWLILTFGGMGMTELALFVTIWGLAAGFGAQAFYALFASELFHTKYRAQAQGLMFCVVRIGVGLISLVVPAMISTIGFQTSGMIMIAFLVISLVIGVIMAPETRNRSLEEIQHERYGKSA